MVIAARPEDIKIHKERFKVVKYMIKEKAPELIYLSAKPLNYNTFNVGKLFIFTSISQILIQPKEVLVTFCSFRHTENTKIQTAMFHVTYLSRTLSNLNIIASTE
jgi:hypothetical protein